MRLGSLYIVCRCCGYFIKCQSCGACDTVFRDSQEALTIPACLFITLTGELGLK